MQVLQSKTHIVKTSEYGEYGSNTEITNDFVVLSESEVVLNNIVFISDVNCQWNLVEQKYLNLLLNKVAIRFYLLDLSEVPSDNITSSRRDNGVLILTFTRVESKPSNKLCSRAILHNLLGRRERNITIHIRHVFRSKLKTFWARL